MITANTDYHFEGKEKEPVLSKTIHRTDAVVTLKDDTTVTYLEMDS
jgi:hypothetical protein